MWLALAQRRPITNSSKACRFSEMIQIYFGAFGYQSGLQPNHIDFTALFRRKLLLLNQRP
jgi:hypothetical protein